MLEKAYLSEVFSPWTMAQQEKTLAAVIAGWPETVTIYRDHLDQSQQRSKRAALLVERSALLRLTTRNEPARILVASLAVLAWNENDFRELLESVFARSSVIISVDDKLTISPEMPLSDAVAAWKMARKRSRTIGVHLKGAQVSADKKKAKAAAGAEKIRPFWGLPADEWPTQKLREMAGTETKPMAYNTIVEHLGVGRAVARKRHQAVLKRKATLVEREMVL